MRVFVATVLCPLVAHCAAQPFNSTSSKLSNSTSNSTSCISAADAVLIADGFGQILSNFSTSFGDILIADGYTDQSDSVATLMHSPNVIASDLGKITFDSKASFLAGEQAQPGVPFKLLNTWSSCNAVTFRYVLSPPGLNVQGIAVAEVEEAKKNGTGVGEGTKKWQIKTFYGEFNSAVWLTDLKSGITGCDVSGNVTGNGTVA
ncbi:unnamed protein product [Aureobasidium mustum]|uniref:NTF2-like domain-containing protein n=1 Tax=Aureobasidium mustum TaxID=2773714 RepID=A0A9N8K2G7_9PEZI|nr:unnamed protein product [Aureobasidium mustum]